MFKMYCCNILFCYVLIIILHNSCLLAQKEPITIIEEYLRRRGHARSSFDYNFSDLLHSNDVVSQGQPDKMVTHNFTEDKNDKSLEVANEETLDDTNNRTNGEPHRGLLKKPIEDATVEKEVKEQKLDQVLDDQEPVVLVKDGLIEDSQKLVTNDQSDLLVHDEQVYDKPKYKIQDKYKLPIHGIIGKQSFNIPELGIHETFIPNAKSSLPKIKSNYINEIQSPKQVPKYKSSENNPKAIIKDTTDKANDEAYDDATVTTKKYHHIPKPSTPRHETVDIFQKVLENDLKEAEEYKTTNKLLVTVQKPKTAKKLKKVTYDKTQPINFMSLYTSSDSDKESVPKNVFKKPIKDKSISVEKISVDFKNINHKNDEKRETTKVHDVKLTLNVENITTNEPAQTESEEVNDELKNYYNRGKLVSGQTVKDIMDGKNVFFTYTNEYPLRGRRNLEDSVPESIEPNTGELVSEDIHIDNYDPVDGTIDGLGPVKIGKTITNNGTQAKKHHHHHHHHHKKHHSKNKVRQQPTGFPGNVPDILFLDVSQNENMIPD